MREVDNEKGKGYYGKRGQERKTEREKIKEKDGERLKIKKEKKGKRELRVKR